MLTGESVPIEVSPGSRVIGASLNNNGRIIVKATRIGSDTELARITAMVVQAQGQKAPIQKVADQIAADRYLASKQAMSRRNRGLRISRIVSPGTGGTA